MCLAYQLDNYRFLYFVMLFPPSGVLAAMTKKTVSEIDDTIRVTAVVIMMLMAMRTMNQNHHRHHHR